MNRKNLLVPVLSAALGAGLVVATLAVAEPAKDAKSATAAPTEFKLPPGWTEADMQACMAAATPGKMHEKLAAEAGVWECKNTMWMAPGTEPMTMDSKSTITPIMDGRYTKMDVTGAGPMGPFTGMGVYGFDNVAGKFVGTWIDSMSTGIMNGTGELSPDGKTLNWDYTYHCPVTKKATTMRQVEKITGEKTRTIEMFTIEPKSGKEYKMMVIEMTKAK